MTNQDQSCSITKQNWERHESQPIITQKLIRAYCIILFGYQSIARKGHL